MQKFDASVQYVLNPTIRFRKDAGKCFQYTVDEFFHAVENLTVTPLDVILLLLFENGRTIGEVSKSFSYVIDFQGNEWLSPPSREIFPVDSPCRSCEESLYQECHKLYSRCLRYIREFTGTTEGPDTKYPFAAFPKTRIV